MNRAIQEIITFTNFADQRSNDCWTSFSYIENIKTGQIYYDESAFTLMVKCTAIFFAAPFFTLGVMLWNVHQIFRSIKFIAHNVFHAARGDFVLGRYFDAAQILDREIKHFPGILKERIFEIIKAPLYGLGLQLAALSGIIRPFHGRQFVSLIDKSWHNGATYKDDIWRVILRHKEIDSACWEDMHGGKEMFLAYCFQERGNVRKDPNFYVLRQESL